jgi:hypothetical protein
VRTFLQRSEQFEQKDHRMLHASIEQRLQTNLTEQKTLRTPTRRICTIQHEDYILQESALHSLQKRRVNKIGISPTKGSILEPGSHIGDMQKLQGRDIREFPYNIIHNYKGDIDKLTQDHLWAIQFLYGKPKRLKYELIPTTVKISTITEQPDSAHPHEPKANSTKSLEPNLPDLCSINHPDNLLLTSNHHLYTACMSQLKQVSGIKQKLNLNIFCGKFNVWYTLIVYTFF